MEKGIKRCATCKKEKPLSDFGKRVNGRYRSYCRLCQQERSKKYRENNPEAWRKSNLKRKYGITIQEYNLMFLEQQGKCAICGTHQKDLNRKLSIDHDHETGEVRGLLCYKCNTALGGFKDHPELLIKAIKYLEV